MKALPSIRRRPVALLAIVAGATLAACGTGGSTELASDELPAASTVPTTPATGKSVQPGPNSYRVEMSLSGVGEDGPFDLGRILVADVEPDQRAVAATVEITEEAAGANEDLAVNAQLVAVGDRVAERGTLGEFRGSNPSAWRESDVDDAFPEFAMETNFERFADGLDATTDGDSFTTTFPSVSDPRIDQWAGLMHLATAFGALRGDIDHEVTVTATATTDGRVASITLDTGSGDDQVHGEIVFSYPMQPFEIPTIDAPAEEPVNTPPVSVFDGGVGDAEPGVEPMDSMNGPIYYRLNVYLDDDLNVSLTPGGELVVVTQTEAYAGPDAFTSYRLTDEGIARVLAEISTHPLVTTGARVGYRTGVSLEMGGSIVFDAHPDHGPVDPAISEQIDGLIDRLADPSWLGDDVVSGPSPWVPDSLTVVATHDGAAIGGLGWPFPSSIASMSTPGMTWNGAEETIVCLAGDDAAAFWPLLAGQNHANLPIVDADGGWNVNVLLNWPGYRLAGDPCGAGN